MMPSSPRSRRERPAVDAGRWDEYVRAQRCGHFLQTTAWGDLKSDFGWQAARASVVGSDGAITGGALVLTRRLPALLGTLAYAPRGPVANWDDAAAAAEAVNTASAVARARGAFALVIEPELLDTPLDRRALGDLGFSPLEWTVQPPRTVWVNLDVEHEVDILGAMRQKTRYNIGLAARKGVTVREGGLTDVARFYEMMRTTSDRNEFGIHSQAYYEAFLRRFDGHCALMIAEHEGEALAGLITVANGPRATYLYGASGNAKRELMPAYALQWQAMRWARARGCHTYDLWGVPDQDEAELEQNFNQRSDGLWGVYRFKRGFGGQVVRHVGAWVRAFSPVRWWVFSLARRGRGLT